MGDLTVAFADVVDRTVSAARTFYADRLISVVLYGSVARGTMRHDSDVDLLIVADTLPNGRLNRVREFEAVEESLKEEFSRAAGRGVHPSLSPVFKTAHEVQAGSPLFLDMVEDARVLYDRTDFLRTNLPVCGASSLNSAPNGSGRAMPGIGISSRTIVLVRCSSCDERIRGQELS